MGFGEIVDGFADMITGPENASLLDRSGDIFEQSLSVGSLFGFKGDAADVQGLITGQDPYSGQELSAVDRWMSILGPASLGGGVIGAAKVANLGFPSNTLLTRGRVSERPTTSTFDLTPGDRVFKETNVYDRVLTRLNDEEGLSNPDQVFQTTLQRTNDLLKISTDLDPVTGAHTAWSKLAQDLTTVHTKTGSHRLDGDTDAIAGFLEGILAPRLRDDLPSLRAAVTQDPANPHTVARGVAFTLAQWEFAQSWENFTFAGKVGPAAVEEWNRLLRGEAANTELITDAMVKFARGVDFVQDPELRVNPMVAFSHIDLDGLEPVVSMKALQWSQVPFDSLTSRAAQERVQALVSMHPSNMVFVFKDNLKQLFQHAAMKPRGVEWQDWFTDMKYLPEGIDAPADMGEVVSQWRKWYAQARIDLEERSTKLMSSGLANKSLHFSDEEKAAEWLTVVAAVTSAAEDWGTNVDKAAKVAEYLYSSKRKKTFKGIHKDINKVVGVKVPETDLVKILLLEGFENASDVFRTGATSKADGPMSTEALARELDKIAKGTSKMTIEELARRRKLPQPWNSQKQDSFNYAIRMSRESDLEERAEYLYQLMRGELGGVLDATHGGDTRALVGVTSRVPLPVVADRQHFKAALGFSMIPDTWYTGQAGAYDQFAHAARLVAAEIGELDGRPVLPEEVQAITWMRYRAMSHYTDPAGRDWPRTVKSAREKIRKQRNEGKISARSAKEQLRQLETDGTFEGAPAVAFTKDEIGQTLGFKSPQSGNASWTDGAGPDLMFSNSVMKYVSGEAVAPLPSTRFVDAATDLTRYRVPPDELRPNDASMDVNLGNHLEEVTFEIAQDTSVKFLGEPGVLPRRGRVPSSAMHNDKQVMVPMRDIPVDDATYEFERINATSRLVDNPNADGMTGAMLHSGDTVKAKHPHYQEGPMISVSFMTDTSDFGDTVRATKARLTQFLRSRGIGFKVVDLPSHEGISKAWKMPRTDDHPGEHWSWNAGEARRVFGPGFMDKVELHTEARSERVLRFDSVEDLEQAVRALRSTASEHPPLQAAQRYMAEYHPGQIYRRPNVERFESTYAREELAQFQAEVTEWYDTLPTTADNMTPDEVAAYEALVEAIDEQFEFLTSEMGLRFEATDADPYATPAEMVADIVNNNRLKVLKTKEGEHPYFSAETNDRFRFIHDYFGHAVHETDFSRYGEELAYVTHSQMFPEAALPALFTELRGQNFALIRKKDFQPQRVGLPPKEWLSRWTGDHAAWADDTWARRITRDQVADLRIYVDHHLDAPPATVGFWEHAYTDANGRTLFNINVGGAANRTNASRVFLLDDDLGGYLANSRSARLDTGGGKGQHLFSEDGTVFDNRMQWVIDHSTGQELRGNGRSVWGTTVNTPTGEVKKSGPYKGEPKFESKAIDEFHLYMPPPGDPTLPTAAVDLELLADLDPSRIVKVSKGTVRVRNVAGDLRNRKGFKVELPEDEAGVDPILFDHVRELLMDTSDVGEGTQMVSAVGARDSVKISEQKAAADDDV